MLQWGNPLPWAWLAKHPPRRPVKALPKVGCCMESKWHLQTINESASCVSVHLFLCHWVWKWIMGGMAMARRCQNTTTSTEAGDPCTFGDDFGVGTQWTSVTRDLIIASLLILFIVLGGIICHIFLPVLGTVTDLPTLASCQQVLSQLAPRLLCVRLLRWAQKADGRWLTEMHVLIIATHLCFPVTLPPTITNWNNWTCFCFSAFDPAACHDVQGNLFDTVYIFYWWARIKVENMTISMTFVMRPALRHLAFKEKIAPGGFVSPTRYQERCRQTLHACTKNIPEKCESLVHDSYYIDFSNQFSKCVFFSTPWNLVKLLHFSVV